MAASVLVVDDEVEVVSLLSEWLREAGYTVHGCCDGKEALRAFFEKHPDLSVVDIRMPGLDGFTLISRIRELSNRAVLVLSALAGTEDVVRGLDLGADEYLVKPVAREVFLARVRSLLRRASPEPEVPQTYTDAALHINLRAREVYVRGERVHLLPTEYRLLTLLVLKQDSVLTYEEILDQVWGKGEGSLDSLKWYVSSLRQKLEETPSTPRLILNVRSAGYRYLRPPGELPPGAR